MVGRKGRHLAGYFGSWQGGAASHTPLPSWQCITEYERECMQTTLKGVIQYMSVSSKLWVKP